MEQTRSAVAVWHGNLANGSGEVSSATSTHIRNVPVSWSSRTEDAAGQTSPEELLAAAHAACFNMSLSGKLAKAGFTAETLETRADVTFEKAEAGWRVATSHLTVRAQVPEIDDAQFAELADAAKDGCPISVALSGNVELSVDAALGVGSPA